MTSKCPAKILALLLAAGALVMIGNAPANAGPKTTPKSIRHRHVGSAHYNRPHVVYRHGPNVVYQQGPHTRLYVTKRSWLDAGTEPIPGEQTSMDYAFPPRLGFPSFARENNNRPLDRQPLDPPSDMWGWYPTQFPLY
ncbi:MAG: hypothetical protein ACREDC_07680 [Bradyrhizobium sp.]